MENDLIWKALTIFNILFFFLWVIFFTYQPHFMGNDSFVAPGNSNRGSDPNRSDNFLSDHGRSLIFLSSLLSSLVFIIFVFGIFTLFFRRKIIKCPKGAKTPGDCKFKDI